MHSCEATGKTIEQAVQNALLELKASREDVDIKILNEGGFLKKAKVLVSISEDAIEKYERKEKIKQSMIEEKNDEDFAEKFLKNKVSLNAKSTEENVPKKETKAEEKPKQEKEEQIQEENSPAERRSKEVVEKKFTPTQFVEGVLKCLGKQANISVTEDEKFETYHLTGENLNELIGYHGECMLSLSYLMSLVCKNESRKRLVLDVENYRQKREDSLTALAKRVADKVAKTKRYYKLEPMDASERKIIHLALQDDERVTTLSKGEEPHRYLIVFPKDYDERN